MKNLHILLIMLTLGFVQQTYAQTQVADCPIHLQQRQPMKDYTLAYFNLQGMNLARYDWKNKQLNCDINHYNAAWKKQRTFNLVGYTVLPVGVGLLMGGILAVTSMGEGGGYLASGAILSLGGIGAFVYSSIAKKKKNKHYNDILLEYSTNPWNQ